MSPRLILFPVPMSQAPGSPADVMPRRNIELLSEVRHFVVENLRSARRFLRSAIPDFPIDDCTFSELNRHTRPEDIAAMLEPMSRGFDMGVISEAGCPAVADPGADVVALAQRKGFEVVPLVGPSSILMAVMASGFNGQSFAFAGYLPVDDAARASRLKEMQRRIIREGQTQIFIETPYRNNRLIASLCETLPSDMLLCVASDITGPDQSIVTLPIARWRGRKYNYDKIPTIFLLHKN